MSNSALDGEIRDGRHVMSVRVYYEDTDFSGVVYYRLEPQTLVGCKFNSLQQNSRRDGTGIF